MKNWKTTTLGLIGAALTFLQTYTTNGGNLSDWKLYIFPLVVALFGYFSKDMNVTGGSTPQ